MSLFVLILPSRQLYVPRYFGSEDNERRHDLLTHKLPKALIHLVKDHYNVKAHETSWKYSQIEAYIWINYGAKLT